jgi:lysylphosphatidylglycerol synthetase-like protein (DUF2156 family)
MISHMKNRDYLIPGIICVALGGLLIPIDGIAGLRFILILSLCILLVNHLSRTLVKRRKRCPPRVLLNGLPVSVIVVAVFLFLLAIARGADAVASLPAWVWEVIVIYCGIALGVAIKFSGSPVHNQNPFQPPTSSERA